MNKDIIEENSAATALIFYLSGKRIINTSGDENHRINPVAIELKVGLSKEGEELSIVITQTDRHHPHLVYDTIKQHLSEMEEFKNYHLKELKPDYDYNQETGQITLRYNVPSGAADSIIHSLSEKGQQIKSIPQSGIISEVIEYFTAGKNIGLKSR